MQALLVLNPERGAIIPGSGGLRKLRWGVDGRGKRGGVRLIYYYAPNGPLVFMLFLFAKNEQSDLTPDQLRKLRALVEHEFGNARANRGERVH